MPNKTTRKRAASPSVESSTNKKSKCTHFIVKTFFSFNNSLFYYSYIGQCVVN